MQELQKGLPYTAAAVDRPEASDDRHVDEYVSRAGKHLRQFSLGRGFEIVEVYIYMVNFPGKK